jgi:hypothetical protein
MRIVVPVSKHDAGLTEEFCEAINVFGPYSNHVLTVVARPSDFGVAEKVLQNLTKFSLNFKSSELIVFEKNGPEGWPQGPNFYWTETIKFLAGCENALPWFWMEMDTTPVISGWLDLLELEYRESKAVCLGVVHKSEFASSPHLAGVAVYPPRLDLEIDSWRHVTSTDTAFDVFCAYEIVPKSLNTGLIQHNFRTGGYHCSDRGLKGFDLQKHHMNESFALPVKDSAVVVHGCNDGSLARVVSGRCNPKIYTYFEDLGRPEQEALVNAWVLNWGAHGFEPIVLGVEDAKKSDFYEEFISAMESVHMAIMGAPLGDYGKSCYARWLAYSTVKGNLSFSVSDYDVFNRDFLEIRRDKLTFFNHNCPCFAYGSPSQFLNFCKIMAFVAGQNLQNRLEKHDFRHFNDQEFLCLFGRDFPDAFECVPWKDRIVSLYGELDKRELVHIAHIAVHDMKIKHPNIYGGVNSDALRVHFSRDFI